MLELIPTWLNITFVVITIIAIALFHWSNRRPNKATVLILVYAVLLSLLAMTGFYTINDALPPHFFFAVVPAILFIAYGLMPKRRAITIVGRNLTKTTLIHTIRIPVEICLHYLFIYKAIPDVMTWDGRNFDVISGITAPFMAWLWSKGMASKNVMIVWNIICLALLLFVVGNAVLSVESPIQQFGFDQPNQGVLYFPFILLPGIVVPLVIYTHIVDIITLVKTK